MKITIKNFRGIEYYTMDATGNTVIAGKNGAGKSTIYDAFLWCISGADRHGKDVNILPPPDEKNKPAQVIIVLNGKAFSREYSEKWTRKRGSDYPEFTGYQTNLTINSLDVDRATFTQAVAESFAGTDVLPIITNPEWFFDMDWKNRRQLIMKLVGIPQPIDFDGELAKLEKERKLILKDQEEYPARIDELRRNYREIEGVNEEVIEQAKTLIDNLQKQMAATPRHDQVAADNLDALINKANEEVMAWTSAINNAKRERAQTCEDIHYLENEMAILRIKYSEEVVKTFQSFSFVCRNCGQQLPVGMVETEEDFNRKKSETLEKIQAQGFKLKDSKTLQEESVKKIDADIAIHGQELDKARQLLKELTTQKMEVFNHVNPLHAQIQEQIQKSQTNLNELLAIRQQQHLNQGVFARINELETNLAAINSEAAKKEAEIFAIRQQQKLYINQVTEAANHLWHGVTFEMFRQQINGGIADACDVYIDGINAVTANNALRIYYSLVIADSLNKNKLPMFIDNAESCQSFPVTEAPQIRLIVADGQLNVTII